MSDFIGDWVEAGPYLRFLRLCQSCGTVNLFGLRYTCPDWEPSEFGESESVVVVLDPEDMSMILVRDLVHGELLPAPCSTPSYVANLSLWEHLENLALARPAASAALERIVIRVLGIEHEFEGPPERRRVRLRRGLATRPSGVQAPD